MRPSVPGTTFPGPTTHITALACRHCSLRVASVQCERPCGNNSTPPSQERKDIKNVDRGERKRSKENKEGRKENLAGLRGRLSLYLWLSMHVYGWYLQIGRGVTFTDLLSSTCPNRYGKCSVGSQVKSLSVKSLKFKCWRLLGFQSS